MPVPFHSKGRFPMPGDGHLVTTNFVHHHVEVHDLHIRVSADVIGTTSGHLFWSEDLLNYFPISDSRPGERMLTATGKAATFESLTPRPQRETVYNIEVDAQHVYSVGADGLLVHNSCRTRANHVYRIVDTWTGQVQKYGISASKIGRNGSYRAVSQVNRLNLLTPGRYRHDIIARNVTRTKALAIERGRVTGFAKALDKRLGRTLMEPFEGPDGNILPLPDPTFR